MPLIDHRAALAEHPLFSRMDAADRDQLLALGMDRRFNDGQLIFQRGDPGVSMMLVLRGQVRISILSEEGKELVFNLIQPGECFGEIALLDRPASQRRRHRSGPVCIVHPGSRQLHPVFTLPSPGHARSARGAVRATANRQHVY